MRRIDDQVFRLLLLAVTVAFAWILWPFYGAILWAIVVAVIFAPVHRRLLQTMQVTWLKPSANLQKQIEDLQKAIDFFEGKLPREKEVYNLLREVSKAAEGANLEIRQFEPMMTVRGSHYNEQPVRIVLAGEFEGFYAYMLELEKLARITRVTDMKLKKMQERNGAMEAEMTLSIFFEPTLIGGSVATSR